MFYLKLIWIFLVVRTECSEVRGLTHRLGISTFNYCPVSKFCPEGTHVLCLFEMRLAPKCGTQARLLTMTDSLAEWVLTLINHFRASIAQGEETGKDGVTLPRGYGIKRVKWDNELATFAQLWANQCTSRYGFCHATERFPEQGAILGLKRFSYPNWERLSKNGTDKKPVIFGPVLNISKEVDAVTSIFRLAQNLKNEVDKQLILNYSEIFNQQFEKDGSVYTVKNYLEIISNWTTHVGCGMVSSVEFVGYDPTRNTSVVNVIELVCYFGGKPVVGRPVYETEKPTEEGYTPECGCPPGYYEDASCLCYEGSLENEDDIEKISHTCSSSQESDCKPSVLLLPIFRIEDAPPDKLYNPRKNRENQKETRRFIRKRYFNKTVPPRRSFGKGGYPAHGEGLVSKNMSSSSTMRQSIFTRVSKFQLPVKHKHEKINGILANNLRVNDKTKETVTDIKPRKDFSIVQELVKIYGSKKHNKIDTLPPNHHGNQVVHPIVPKSQKKLHDFNISVTKRNSHVKTSSDKHDQIINLLDNLEQKVKYSELNVRAKEIIDAKIRKIYGHVVGDSDYLLKPKRRKNQHSLNDDIEKTDKDNVLFSSDYEHGIVGQHIPLTRPFKDNQKAFKMDVKPRFERYKTGHRIFDTRNTDLTRPLKGSLKSLNLFNKPSFENYKTKHVMYDTDDGDLTIPTKRNQESFELFDKPRFGRIKTKHRELSSVSNIPISDTDDRDEYLKEIHDFNDNYDRYESIYKVRNGHYYSNGEDKMFDERNKYYQKRPSSNDRKRNRNRGYSYRNEWYNDYDRPVITPHDRGGSRLGPREGSPAPKNTKYDDPLQTIL